LVVNRTVSRGRVGSPKSISMRHPVGDVRLEAVETRGMNREQHGELEMVEVPKRRTTRYSSTKRRQLMDAAKRRWAEGASIARLPRSLASARTRRGAA
jgi:hypothetical protein